MSSIDVLKPHAKIPAAAMGEANDQRGQESTTN